MRELHFFVCRNGFGHQKRVLSVINELVHKNPLIKVSIHCHQSTFERTRNWTITQNLLSHNFITFEFQCMENAPEYLNGVTFQSINKWLEKVKTISADYKGLIIIDNDVSLLQIFHEALIMGSFLWSDVLNNSKENSEFNIFEKTLIQKYQPSIIGVNSMAMPFIGNYNNFIGFPWFCNSHPNKCNNFKERSAILVTGGGTKSNQSTLIRIARKLMQNGEEVYVDQNLSNFSNQEFQEFGFQDIDFLNLKAVFCRPGMGILNDCIAYGIPIFAVKEENAELIHNGSTIQKLKLGLQIHNDEQSDIFIEHLKMETLLKFHHEICHQKTEGAILVAEYINNLLLNERN